MLSEEISTVSAPIERYYANSQGATLADAALDLLAIEEPLEIRLEFESVGGPVKKSISVTMRTPGHDEVLAAGFLFTEGILTSPAQIASIKACGPQVGAHSGQNIVRVILAPGVVPPLAKLERHFYTTSSCGICGKASLDAVLVRGVEKIARDAVRISRGLVDDLPDILRAAQANFAATGGIHGAALVTNAGEVTATFEDVGRHNAVDKVIGSTFLEGVDCRDQLMVVSGRAGFELVQKSLVAGIPALLAIGAPSSLAVELAQKFDMTLVGFMRHNRFNVYSGGWRIHG